MPLIDTSEVMERAEAEVNEEYISAATDRVIKALRSVKDAEIILANARRELDDVRQAIGEGN